MYTNGEGIKEGLYERKNEENLHDCFQPNHNDVSFDLRSKIAQKFKIGGLFIKYDPNKPPDTVGCHAHKDEHSSKKKTKKKNKSEKLIDVDSEDVDSKDYVTESESPMN